MSLKKFEDFENGLREEDKQALANDYVNAKKDLLKFIKALKVTNFIDKDGEFISVDIDEDKNVLLKVIGYTDLE